MQPSVCSRQVRIRCRGRRLLWGHWPWSHGRKALAALSPRVLQKPEPLEGWWRNVWTWEDVGAPSRANKAPAETSLETEKKVQLWSKALLSAWGLKSSNEVLGKAAEAKFSASSWGSCEQRQEVGDAVGEGRWGPSWCLCSALLAEPTQANLKPLGSSTTAPRYSPAWGMQPGWQITRAWRRPAGEGGC